MGYKKKTNDEILELVEEFQKESLFRAYCNSFTTEGVCLPAAEVWAEAKDLLSILSKKMENAITWVNTYWSLYADRYISLFSHLPTLQDQVKASMKVREKVFTTALLMCYHCMKCSSDINNQLTFEKEEKVLAFTAAKNDFSKYYEYWTLSNLYGCIGYVTFFIQDEKFCLLEEEYMKQKEKVGIEFDCDYTGLTNNTYEENMNATPTTTDIKSISIDKPKVFLDEEGARIIYDLIKDPSVSFPGTYSWVALYALCNDNNLLISGNDTTLYKLFSSAVNGWYTQSSRNKKCGPSTLSKWGACIAYLQNTPDYESLPKYLKKNKNIGEDSYEKVKALYDELRTKYEQLTATTKTTDNKNTEVNL